MTFVSLDDPTTTALLDSFRDHGDLANWIDGAERPSTGEQFEPIDCPYNGGTLGRVPFSSPADLDAAVTAAGAAFATWSRTGIKERAQVMFRLKRLLEERIDELARTVALENGKTIAEAKAEILKGIEVVEYASALPNLTRGSLLTVADGVDCSLTREPLGVVASVTPFNFPLMVPLWTLPIALTLGNTTIHKPSEQVPLSAMNLARLLAEAGLPDGVFNVVHGGREVVEAICDHPGIVAVSFVGSTPVARAVYRRGCAHDKRVLSLGGAKNHIILMPDADPQSAPKAIVDAATGCAGQRCMAASVLIAVAGSEPLVAEMGRYAGERRLPHDMGAIINRRSLERIRRYVDEAVASGATLLADGRDPDVAPELRNGNWIGPTLLDRLPPDAPAARDEIFGPVLSILHADDLDAALELERSSPYGNAAAVFTSSGETAREVARRAEAGMIGVNIGVPVPREPFSFGGWNHSKFGVGDITGDSSIGFWTRDRKVTVRWA